MEMKPEFLEQHRASMRRHTYQWTGRSRDTCAYTQGSVWCSLGEADEIHQPAPAPPEEVSVVYWRGVLNFAHKVFTGDRARARAEEFIGNLPSEHFPAIASNDAANEAYGAEMARTMLGDVDA